MEFFYTFFGGMLENACFLSIFKILAFSLQLLSENKEHIESNIQHLRILISIVWQETGSESRLEEFKESFLYRGKFFGKISPIKEISYDFSSFIKENVVSLHPD